MSDNSPMPQDSQELAVIAHRVTQLEANYKILFEVRDAVRDIALKMEVQKTQYCPAPGKCLELEKHMEAMQEKLTAANATARTAGWMAKGLAGIVATAGTVYAMWKR